MNTNDDSSRRRKRRADCSVAKLMENTTGFPANEEDRPAEEEEEEIVDIAAALAEAEKKRLANRGLIIKRSCNYDDKSSVSQQVPTPTVQGTIAPTNNEAVDKTSTRKVENAEAEESSAGPQSAVKESFGGEAQSATDSALIKDDKKDRGEDTERLQPEVAKQDTVSEKSATVENSEAAVENPGTDINGSKSEAAESSKEEKAGGDASVGHARPEGTPKGESASPFGVGGGVFSSFPLAADGPQPFQLSAGNNLDQPEGSGKDASASLLPPSSESGGGRPQVFPGEEDENVVFSTYNAGLSKCYKEENVYRFKSRGPGVCRILVDKTDKKSGRLVFRQAATWHVLLNSPLSVVGNFNAVGAKFKFSAYDFEDEKAGLCMFALKFADPNEAKEFQTLMKSLIKTEQPKDSA